MKILSVQQIREADAYTISNEPVRSVDLMERAASKCLEKILALTPADASFIVVCGNGNNGGDGLAIARMLALKERKVLVKIVKAAGHDSDDFSVNLERLKQTGKVETEIYTAAFSLRHHLNTHHIFIIDAIFGTGLSREADGIAADAISALNASGWPVISVDIPSGLFADDNLNNSYRHVIRAQHTLTFQQPKLAFMFAEHQSFVGQFHILDIHLHPVFIADAETPFHLVTHRMASAYLHHRNKFDHKGNFGHVLIAAGSKGKYGAAVMALRAALKTGAGLVTAFIPRGAETVVQTAVPEAMALYSDEQDILGGRIIPAFSAIGIGPGIDTAKETQQSLKLLLNEFAGPLVMDADALNILAENKTWLAFLPKGTILTPHPGEFDRMFGKHTNGYQRMLTQREMAVKYGVYIVLKGAFTSIASPDGSVYFNSSGNPGMATGGSGDVLTGMLTSLLAQKYAPLQACILGVYLHGLAGNIAASVEGEEAMTATDIIENIGGAYRMLREK